LEEKKIHENSRSEKTREYLIVGGEIEGGSNREPDKFIPWKL
jgi:hypothetical protein